MITFSQPSARYPAASVSGARLAFGKRKPSGSKQPDETRLTGEQAFRREFRKYPRLSPWEREDLLRRIYRNPDDQDALNRLLMPFQDLAMAMAHKVLRRHGVKANSNIQSLDLVQASYLEVLKAIRERRIDPNLTGKTFVDYLGTTYARTMLHHVWRNLHQVPAAHEYHLASVKVFAIKYQFEHEHGRQPTNAEVLRIAQEQGMKERYLRHVEDILNRPVSMQTSLDKRLGDDPDDRVLAEYIADPRPTAESLAHISIRRTRLIAAVAKGFAMMTPLQQYIVARHCGLWQDKEQMSQQEIAEELVALTGDRRGRESISVAEQTGMRTLVAAVLPEVGLEEELPEKMSDSDLLHLIVSQVSPGEASSFLPPQPVMLLLVALGQKFDLKKPMAELSPVSGKNLRKAHKDMPDREGFMVRYDWTQMFKPKAFNERLVEVQEFLGTRADLHLVYPGDLKPFCMQPGNHNRELRMVIFPPFPEDPGGRPQVFMERSEGTGMLREILKAKLGKYTPAEQVILTKFFDLDETGQPMTTTAISALPDVPFSQAYVSKIKNRIVKEVEAEIRRRFPNGSQGAAEEAFEASSLVPQLETVG